MLKVALNTINQLNQSNGKILFFVRHIYTVKKKKRITHFYFSRCKFCDLPVEIKWPI